jgi:hypothetical protein
VNLDSSSAFVWKKLECTPRFLILFARMFFGPQIPWQHQRDRPFDCALPSSPLLALFSHLAFLVHSIGPVTTTTTTAAAALPSISTSLHAGAKNSAKNGLSAQFATMASADSTSSRNATKNSNSNNASNIAAINSARMHSRLHRLAIAAHTLAVAAASLVSRFGAMRPSRAQTRAFAMDALFCAARVRQLTAQIFAAGLLAADFSASAQDDGTQKNLPVVAAAKNLAAADVLAARVHAAVSNPAFDFDFFAEVSEPRRAGSANAAATDGSIGTHASSIGSDQTAGNGESGMNNASFESAAAAVAMKGAAAAGNILARARADLVLCFTLALRMVAVAALHTVGAATAADRVLQWTAAEEDISASAVSASTSDCSPPSSSSSSSSSSSASSLSSSSLSATKPVPLASSSELDRSTAECLTAAAATAAQICAPIWDISLAQVLVGEYDISSAYT